MGGIFSHNTTQSRRSRRDHMPPVDPRTPNEIFREGPTTKIILRTNPPRIPTVIATAATPDTATQRHSLAVPPPGGGERYLISPSERSFGSQDRYAPRREVYFEEPAARGTPPAGRGPPRQKGVLHSTKSGPPAAAPTNTRPAPQENALEQRIQRPRLEPRADFVEQPPRRYEQRPRGYAASHNGSIDSAARRSSADRDRLEAKIYWNDSYGIVRRPASRSGERRPMQRSPRRQGSHRESDRSHRESERSYRPDDLRYRRSRSMNQLYYDDEEPIYDKPRPRRAGRERTQSLQRGHLSDEEVEQGRRDDGYRAEPPISPQEREQWRDYTAGQRMQGWSYLFPEKPVVENVITDRPSPTQPSDSGFTESHTNSFSQSSGPLSAASSRLNRVAPPPGHGPPPPPGPPPGGENVFYVPMRVERGYRPRDDSDTEGSHRRGPPPLIKSAQSSHSTLVEGMKDQQQEFYYPLTTTTSSAASDYREPQPRSRRPRRGGLSNNTRQYAARRYGPPQGGSSTLPYHYRTVSSDGHESDTGTLTSTGERRGDYTVRSLGQQQYGPPRQPPRRYARTVSQEDVDSAMRNFDYLNEYSIDDRSSSYASQRYVH